MKKVTMAKRTRRERRFEAEKQKPITPNTAPTEIPAVDSASVVETEVYPAASSKTAQAAPLNNRKAAEVNFAEEYRHEYRELTTILTISGILFAVMIGLAFVI
jgi:hypothetical protein